MRAAPGGHGNSLLQDEEPTRDVVLGLPALLGIFLAVALICAVCFGFGYSSSHSFHRPTQQTAAAPPVTLSPSRPVPMPEAPPRPVAEPEVDDNPAEAAYPTPTPQAGPDELPEQAQPSRRAPKPAPGVSAEGSLPAARAAFLQTVPQTTPAAGSRAPGPATASAPEASPAVSPLPTQTLAPVGSGLMVQIAAVTRAADAQTLANALRHDGFDAMVRTSTDDRFFHVQVGPFASPQAAKAMRARLADNGYNAFIKP